MRPRFFSCSNPPWFDVAADGRTCPGGLCQAVGSASSLSHYACVAQAWVVAHGPLWSALLGRRSWAQAAGRWKGDVVGSLALFASLAPPPSSASPRSDPVPIGVPVDLPLPGRLTLPLRHPMYAPHVAGHRLSGSTCTAFRSGKLCPRHLAGQAGRPVCLPPPPP